jgi:hypothetical protein
MGQRGLFQLFFNFRSGVPISVAAGADSRSDFLACKIKNKGFASRLKERKSTVSD